MTADIPPRGDLRRRVLAGESTVGAFVGLGAPASAELVARAGYDWAILDLEHGMGSVADLHAQLLAVQTTPTAALVRVPSVERLRIDRALDLGADGVMLPQVRTVAEARDGVSWMRYPPSGVGGAAGLTRGGGGGGDFMAALDRVIAATRRHGKAAGILLRDGASVASAHARGFTFLGVGSDVSFVIAGARRELDAARGALRDA
jgi:2-keto-3-deoxy-L-rhamnonate aldolase RhmA